LFIKLAVEATKQIEEKRKKPEPEEQEGMPQRQHTFAHVCIIHGQIDLNLEACKPRSHVYGTMTTAVNNVTFSNGTSHLKDSQLAVTRSQPPNDFPNGLF
jgi:hypothetical protein